MFDPSLGGDRLAHAARGLRVASVRELDVRVLDHLRPFRDVVANLLGKRLRGVANRRGGIASELRDNLGLVQDFHRFAVQ